jgi:hypothetical protein
MSLDNVTVNMSRLALARAIKTPDGDDSDSDPWDKSVIFHQSHIPQAIEQHKNQKRAQSSHNQRHSHQPRQSRLPQQRIPPTTQRPRSQLSTQIQVQNQAQTCK